MNLKTLLLVNAILAGVFAISMLIFPHQLMEMYGASTDATGTYMMRFFGGSLAMIAIVSFLARESDESVARSAIVKGFAIGSAIGVVVAIAAQMSGIFNALGWSTVVIYLYFALGYGRHGFCNKD